MEERSGICSLEQQNLLKAIPKSPQLDPSGEKLLALLNAAEKKQLPVTSFARARVMSSLPAKITFAYFAYWMRSRFANSTQKHELRQEAHLSAALQLLSTMGYMRGAVMKVGQMLANFPNLMPQQFIDVLQTLHFQAPPMHYAMVRDVLLDELGQEPEFLFAHFEKRAFAAASLGQVHRARLHSGEEVVVKIQYPNMARTIRSDLRNLRTLLLPLRFSRHWNHLDELLIDIEKVLGKEIDYKQEADYYQQAKALFQPDEGIVVPHVFEKYSTTRVLCTDYLAGKHLPEYLSTVPNQQQRNHSCKLIVTAFLRTYYHKRWLIADPHPGNILFLDDGRIGLIDFGCTRVMDDAEWQNNCLHEQGLCMDDLDKIHRAAAYSFFYDSPDEMPPEHLELTQRFGDWVYKPWKQDGDFDFGDEDFFNTGCKLFMEFIQRKYGTAASLHFWGNRSIFGLRSLAFQLKAKVPYKDIYIKESKGFLF